MPLKTLEMTVSLLRLRDVGGGVREAEAAACAAQHPGDAEEGDSGAALVRRSHHEDGRGTVSGVVPTLEWSPPWKTRSHHADGRGTVSCVVPPWGCTSPSIDRIMKMAEELNPVSPRPGVASAAPRWFQS